MIADEAYQKLCTPDQMVLAESFVSSDQEYFTAEDINEPDHFLLYIILNLYTDMVFQHTFRLKKRLLDEMASQYMPSAVLSEFQKSELVRAIDYSLPYSVAKFLSYTSSITFRIPASA